jgi:tetratricopeptide (TPR) repeat protein
MEFVDFETKTFSLLHSKAYETLEMMFYQSVATLNPDTLHNILRENNYHLLSLIQLSEVFKQNGDVSNASDFIERALFAFENSIHASFSLTDGSCRLDFDRIESRPVFIALFRHIQYLSRRGCYKTALEFTKMLFSLDPEDDPLATLLFFDFYCLKAEDYSYFIDFYDVFKNGKGLEHLPSFCYSQALSHWELERMGKKKSHSKSSNLLKRAILAHPEVICTLFQKLEIKDKFLSHPFFNSPRDRGERGLSLRVVEILVAIFVESSHIFWKVPELLSWLKECCRDALVLVSD